MICAFGHFDKNLNVSELSSFNGLNGFFETLVKSAMNDYLHDKIAL